jgi:hypothetical protein
MSIYRLHDARFTEESTVEYAQRTLENLTSISPNLREPWVIDAIEKLAKIARGEHEVEELDIVAKANALIAKN